MWQLMWFLDTFAHAWNDKNCNVSLSLNFFFFFSRSMWDSRRRCRSCDTYIQSVSTKYLIENEKKMGFAWSIRSPIIMIDIHVMIVQVNIKRGHHGKNTLNSSSIYTIAREHNCNSHIHIFYSISIDVITCDHCLVIVPKLKYKSKKK